MPEGLAPETAEITPGVARSPRRRGQAKGGGEAIVVTAALVSLADTREPKVLWSARGYRFIWNLSPPTRDTSFASVPPGFVMTCRSGVMCSQGAISML